MSATVDRRVGPTSKGLDEFAKAAARDLAADAVVITSRTRGGESSIAAAAGLTRSQPSKLLPALAAQENRLGREPFVRVRSLEKEQGEAAQTLLASGFRSALTARVDTDGRRVGAIHILRRRPRAFEHEALIRAYAVHAGVTIASLQTPRRAPPPPPARVIEALTYLGGSARSFPELIQGLDAALSDVIGSGRSGLMLWDPKLDILQMTPGSFLADDRTTASCRVKVSDGQGSSARVFTTGDPFLTNHPHGDPGVRQDFRHAFGVLRFVTVQLAVRGQPVGVLTHADKKGDYKIADLRRLEPLIPHISQSVETANRLFMLNRRLRIERILSDVAVAITSGRSMQESLSAALDELFEAVDASLIMLVPMHASPILWPTDTVTTSAEEQLIAQARKQPERRLHVAGPLRAGDPGSATLHLPVRLATQRIGTLSVLRSHAEPFTPAEQDALTRLARLAALAWAAEGYQQQRAELARLEERQRIADDLHDDVSQILFGAQMALDATLEAPPGGIEASGTENVARARELVILADEALRGVIHQLSHNEPATPIADLASLVSEVEQELGLPIHLDIDAEAALASAQLRRPVRNALLRVAREALVNAAKHAGPCRASVRLKVTRRGRLMIEIIDDGMGIRPNGGGHGHGLTSLRRVVRSQGGIVRVGSTPSGGTRVLASFP
jgi:signal transduction histidine kinase